jgi:hypothetical protein
MPRERGVWSIVSYGVLAALSTAGCFEIGAALGERAGDATLAAFRSHAKVIPCSLAEAPQLVERGVVTRRAFDGPIRARTDVAVVVTRNSWSALGFTTSLDASGIDGRSEARAQDPDGSTDKTLRLPLDDGDCGAGQECFQLTVLPGHHVVTLRAVSEGGDKRRSRIGGRVEFVAEAGGLYSFQVCRPSTNDGPVFWVRDESALTCVSTLCPGK